MFGKRVNRLIFGECIVIYRKLFVFFVAFSLLFFSIFTDSSPSLAIRNESEICMPYKESKLNRLMDNRVRGRQNFIFFDDKNSATQHINQNIQPKTSIFAINIEINLVYQSDPLNEPVDLSSKFTPSYKSLFWIMLSVTALVIFFCFYLLLERHIKKGNQNIIRQEKYISKLSHELRNPLNGIIGMQYLIKQSLHDKEKILEYIEKSEISSNYMRNLINDSLEISKIKNKSMNLHYEMVNLYDLIHELKSILQIQLLEKNIDFTVQSSIHSPFVSCDKIKLMQVLINILNNAIKFSDINGRILLEITQSIFETDNIVKFAISDTGCGMSKNYLDTIWLPFSQEERQNHENSTGLGMTISKEIVTCMGGTLDVWSELGMGTTFTMQLPLLAHKNEINEGEDDFYLGKTVLVVDDNELSREIMSNYLKAEGFVVVVANDGQEAVQLFKKQPHSYDLILLDMHMPKLNGQSACKDIRKYNKYVKIVMVSGDEDCLYKKNKMMDDYLLKPFKMEEFIKKIKILLKKEIMDKEKKRHL